MSKLSTQCDELRRLASTLDTRYRYADDIVTALLEAADTILSLRDRAQDLQSENAKLRELMNIMAYCNQFWRNCDGCRMNGAAGIITERAGCDGLLDRMRELGVEVE